MSKRIWSMVVVLCGLGALAGCGTSTSVSSSGWMAKRESHEATQPQQQQKFTVTMQHFTADAKGSGTGVTVRQITEDGVEHTKYRAILDAQASTDSLTTWFFDTGSGAPHVEVQAGRAYLWGIFPSGRTRRVVTASQAVGRVRVQVEEYREVIFQIDGDIHRVVNVGKTPISISVWTESEVDEDQLLYEIQPGFYRNVTVGKNGDAANPPIEVGGPIDMDAPDNTEAEAVKAMADEMEAKRKAFEKP